MVERMKTDLISLIIDIVVLMAILALLSSAAEKKILHLPHPIQNLPSADYTGNENLLLFLNAVKMHKQQL